MRRRMMACSLFGLDHVPWLCASFWEACLMVSRRSTVWSAMLVMVTVLLSLIASVAPSVAAGPTVVYDSIPDLLPGNVASLGYQATSTDEFGDDIRLADGPRTLDTVTVLMSSWALAATPANLSAPGWDANGWDQPLTLNLYRSTGPANAPVIGSLIAAQSRTFHVPWRPVADPTCPGGTAWRHTDDACYNGKAFTVTFDLSASDITLPSRLIATIAFDTQSHGTAPIGTAGPYNSLNVGSASAGATVGTDVDNDIALLDSTWGGAYSDGGAGGLDTLRVDTGWTGFGPQIQITTTGPDATTEVVREAQVGPSVTQPWSRNSTGNGGATTFVSGPAIAPAGVGSLGLATSLPAAGSKAQLYGYQYGLFSTIPSLTSTRLDSISSLSYSTYRTAGPASIVPSLSIEVDAAGDGSGYTTLVFEPIYNPAQGAPVNDTWQTWDALLDGGAIWWSSQPITGVCAVTCYVTWDQIIASNPNAKIKYGVGPSVGSGVDPAFAGAADKLTIGVNGAEITYDFEPTCGDDCYVSTTGSNSNGGTSFLDAKLTIQAGIDAVNAGGTVHVDDGTYAESPNITKSLTLESANGRDATTIELQSAPTYLGALTIGGAESVVTVDGFTVVGRDAADPVLAASNIFITSGVQAVTISNNRIQVGVIDAGSNGDDGIGILTTYAPADDVDSVVVTDNIFEPLTTTGTRAFYVNPGVDSFTFTGNSIVGGFDRTAATQARIGLVEGNTVTGTGTSASFGTWGYPDPTEFGSTTFRANTITGTATGFRVRESNDVTIENNIVSNVTDGVVVVDDGNVTGLLGSTVVIRDNSFTGITGTYVTNTYATPVNASGNWWGSTVTTAANITGLVDFTPVLTSATDTDVPTPGFQGSVVTLKVHDIGAQIGTEGRIQEGIDTTVTDGTVNVAPGAYSETATNRTTPTGGFYQFGLYFPAAKPGIDVQGVTAADVVITDASATEAVITTNATNNFGFSGIFVVGDRVTIRGLEIGSNVGGTSKTIEVLGDDLSLLDNHINDIANAAKGSVYFGDWEYLPGNSSIATFTIDGNKFAADNQITIASGTGDGHPESGRQIADNVFVSAPTSLFISFRGQAGLGGVPWYTYPVGGATITGNAFGPADINIRATDTYDEAQFDWAGFITDNDYTRLVWVEDDNTGQLQTFSYTSGGYAFVDARQIGGRIDSSNPARPAGVDIANANDTVHVGEGTYPEQAIIDKDDITVDGEGATTLVDDGGTAVGVGLTVSGDGVTVSDLRVQGYLDGIVLTGSGDLVGPSDSLLDGVTITDVDSVDNDRHGLFASAIAGLSNLSIDGGNYSRNNVGGANNAGRGIAVWDGPKSGISITDVHAVDNRLVGIDLNDGSVTGATITGNTVTGNGDSGIGVLGPEGPDANLVADNTVTNNGRFGIEIKTPTANGNASGPGSTVVSGNVVSRTTGTDATNRDFAGIAVFRRSVNALSATQPTGVVVTGNEVSGYVNLSTGDGFGIVVEGTGNVVTLNDVHDNDVGIQAQAGNPSGLPTGDASATGTAYFDRGNAAAYGGVINNNSIDGNTLGFRAVGLAADADVECNWWGAANGPSTVGLGSGDTVSTFADFTPWLITGTLTDDCPLLAEDDAPADLDGDEGTEFTNSGSFDADLASVTASVGVATVGANGAWTWVLADDAAANDGLDPIVPITVTISATALNGSVAEAEFALDITNVAPVATFVFQPVEVGGSTFQISLTSPSDPSTADTTAGFTYTFVCNGVSHAQPTDSFASCTAPAAPTTMTVSGTITDKDGGSTTYGPEDVSVVSALGLTLTPNAQSFGDVVVGQSSTPAVQFTLTNNTNDSYDVDQVGFFVTATSHFEIVDAADACSGETLDPTESCVFDVVFSPQSAGAKSTTLGAIFDGLQPPNPKPQSALTGTGVAPVATIAGNGAFGDVTVGSPETATITVGNNGTSDLHVLSASISGSSRFSVTDSTDCDLPVAPLGSCDIEVTFAPNAAGLLTGSLVVTTDGGTVSTPLSGTGIAAAAPIASLTTPPSFGDVEVGDSADMDITLTNTGTADLHVSSVSTTGSATFTVEDGECADPIAPGDTCLINVVFAPTIVGVRNGVLHVISDGGNPSTALTGTGIAAPAPAASIDPAVGDFDDDTEVGDFKDIEFTVTNTGTGALTFSSIDTTGSATFAIQGTPDCDGASLANGEDCTITVRFTPNNTADRNGTLVVVTNGGTLNVALTGQGVAAPAPEAQLTPSSRDYGDVVVDTTRTRSFTVTNTGDADLVIGTVSEDGATFSIVDDLCSGVTVGDGDTCTFGVRFSPTAVEHSTATVTVPSDASNGTRTANVEGDGVANAPVTKVTPDEYDFGDVIVGDHENKTFTVKNIGTGILTGIDFSTTGSAQFAINDESDCDGTLDADEECDIVVRFTPTSTGEKSGTLKVASTDAVNGTVNVPLSGTGTAAPADVAIDPEDYNFGPVEFGTTKNKTFTFENTGGTAVQVVSVEKVSGSNTFTVPDAQDGCTGANVGPGDSCTFRVSFKAPVTNDSKNAVIEVSGTGFSPVTADVHGQGVPFVAKVDAYITKKTSSPYDYVGIGVFCNSACSEQTVSKNTPKGQWAVYRLRVANDGNGRDSFKLRLSQTGSKSSIQEIKVLRDGNVDVTSRVLNAGYVIRDLNPGTNAYFWVRVKVKSSAVTGKVNNVILTANSQRQTAVKDVNQARTTVVQ